MKAVIEQPTYLPWAGYYGMMDIVDTFVFYDDVQFEAHTWQQRNRIKTAQGVQWLTVPVIKHFGQNINQVEIDYHLEWRKKHWETIKQAYSKSPCWGYSSHFWEELYGARFVYLSDLNQYITRTIAESMECRLPKFLKSSDFVLKGTSNERLIDLLTQLGATEFYEGMAGKDYIDEAAFKRAGIQLTWFDYKPPVYPQLHEHFVSHLSALDLVCNVGNKAIEYIRSVK